MPTLSVLSWRAQAGRGGMAVAFGVLACFLPRVSLLMLVLGFGGFAILDGVVSAVSAFASSTAAAGQRWPDALVGAVGIVCGSVAILAPPSDVAGIAILVGSWAMLTGVMELLAAARLRHEVPGEVLLSQAGALSLAFGIFTVRFPQFTATSFSVLLGVYTIVLGGILLAFAGRLHRMEAT